MRAGRDLTLTAAQVAVRTMRACKPGGTSSWIRSPKATAIASRAARAIVMKPAAAGKSAPTSRPAATTLVAGQDINARAANVTADQQLVVGAGRDVNLTAGVETAYAYDES